MAITFRADPPVAVTVAALLQTELLRRAVRERGGAARGEAERAELLGATYARAREEAPRLLAGMTARGWATHSLQFSPIQTANWVLHRAAGEGAETGEGGARPVASPATATGGVLLGSPSDPTCASSVCEQPATIVTDRKAETP